jgi:hypothetical protein
LRAALGGRIYDHSAQENVVPLGASHISMPSSNAALMRSLDDIAEKLDREGSLHARIRCADGRNIEGEILGVCEDDLIVHDGATGAETFLPALQLLTLDVSSPRRGREWLVAICAIPAVTAILVAFSRIPGVDPKRGDLAIGFMAVLVFVWALGRVPGLGRVLREQLTKWERVYPNRSV